MIPAYSDGIRGSSIRFRTYGTTWRYSKPQTRICLARFVCLAGPHAAGVNHLELVDGQQRLTTISILLHCLLDRLKSESQVDDARDLARLLRCESAGWEISAQDPARLLDAKQFARHANAIWPSRLTTLSYCGRSTC